MNYENAVNVGHFENKSAMVVLENAPSEFNSILLEGTKPRFENTFEKNFLVSGAELETLYIVSVTPFSFSVN